MIKSVVSVVPSYVMSCFKLPNKICRELDGMVANFWWGQHGSEGKIHWVAWQKLTDSKREGGLGFRDFACFNKSLLAKQAWRILKCPNDPWVKVLKGIYFPNSDFFHAGRGSRASWIWSSFLEGRDLLVKGMGWEIGDGTSMNIWSDRWIDSLNSGRLSSSNPGDMSDAVMVNDLIKKWEVIVFVTGFALRKFMLLEVFLCLFSLLLTLWFGVILRMGFTQ